MLHTESMTLKTVLGQSRTVRYGDPLYCTLDHCRVRFSREFPDGMVEVLCGRTGKVLPDLRHPGQLLAY